VLADTAATLPEPSPDVARPAESVLPPPVRAGQLVDLAAVDVRPQPQRRDLPRYTSKARRTRQQGVVEVSLLIDEHGEVAAAELTRDDAGSDLAQAVLAAVRDWKFSPARKDRRPVKVRQEVAIEFTVLPDRSTSVRIRE